MEFSLIIGTLNRSKELAACLDSLLEQKFKNFEVIVIDQSDNCETEVLVKRYIRLTIHYYHVEFKGLSRARNFGLSLARGRYFALVDDDAGYSPDYLLSAYHYLNLKKYIILSGYIIDATNGKILPEYRKISEGSVLSLRQVVRMAPSPALIFPMELYHSGIYFDEDFGVGAVFGACEETDMILQAMDRGYKVIYLRRMEVKHPTLPHSFELENDSILKKRENYACGFGALIVKDKLVRCNNRLMAVKLEKWIRIAVKLSGLLGKGKKEEGKYEYRGVRRGMRTYSARMEGKNDT